MRIEETPLVGSFCISPTVYNDKRGYFFEWFNLKNFADASGIAFTPVQINCSKSTRGVLRGLHFQQEPMSQAKVIGVTSGKIQDVIVDLRKNSPSYGQTFSIILDSDIKNQIFIPKGFAHGFLVLSDSAEIFYAIDNHYSPNHESGLLFNDSDLNISWQMNENEIILSEKDYLYSPFKEEKFNFAFNE